MTPQKSYVMDTSGVLQRQLHLTNGQYNVLVEQFKKSAVAVGNNKNGTTLTFISIL